jgi:hypothetical protein
LGDTRAGDARDPHGKTPLHRAVAASNEAMARLLLANGADVNAKDNKGNTPLSWAGYTESGGNYVDGHPLFDNGIVDLLRQHGGHK